MDDSEEAKEVAKEDDDDESTNRSNSKSMTLHSEKAVQEDEETDPGNIRKDAEDSEDIIEKDKEAMKFHIKELKARLKKLKEEKVDVSNNVSNFFYQYVLLNK